MRIRFEWLGMSEDGTSVTLKKHDGKLTFPDYVDDNWLRVNADSLRVGIALDTETTGLETDRDQIIEIALRKFLFNRHTGEIVAVYDPLVQLQEPDKPLSEKVKFITGLDDDALRGRRIDWAQVDAEIASADILVAHNCAFDRPFVERHAPNAKKKIWGCSYSQIDWEAKGYPIHRLEVLAIHHGFYVDAHRALADVDALLYLISMKDKTSGSSYLCEILTNARRQTAVVVAKNSPYDSKNALREHGYTWNPTTRCWEKQVYRDLVDAELQFLKSAVYTNGSFDPEVHEIPLTGTFRRKCV